MTDERFMELKNEIIRQKRLPNLYKAKYGCKYARKYGCALLEVDDCRKFGKCKFYRKGGDEDAADCNVPKP